MGERSDEVGNRSQQSKDDLRTRPELLIGGAFSIACVCPLAVTLNVLAASKVFGRRLGDLRQGSRITSKDRNLQKQSRLMLYPVCSIE